MIKHIFSPQIVRRSTTVEHAWMVDTPYLRTAGVRSLCIVT